MGGLAQAEMDGPERGIPVGRWLDQSVDWVDTELDWLLDKIRWPVDKLLDLLIEGDTSLVTISWVWVALAAVAIGYGTGRASAGVRAALALGLCRSLGLSIWGATAHTLALVIAALVVATAVASPLVLLSRRSEIVSRAFERSSRLWVFVQPSMILVPAIFFFGIGSTASVMVAASYAVSIMIRYRAAGGRRGWIVSGWNRSLPFVFWVLVVAAVVGAGGIGEAVFTSFATQDLVGIGPYLAAIVVLGYSLDQLTRPDPVASALVQLPAVRSLVGWAAVSLCAASVLLPWSTDGGRLSSLVADSGIDRPGATFNGLSSHGGSFFGIAVLALALLVAIAGEGRLPESTPSVLGRLSEPIGAGIAIAVLGVAFLSVDPVATDRSLEIGPVVALLGGLGLAGSVLMGRAGNHGTRRPPMFGLAAGLLVVVLGVSASWVFNTSDEAILTEQDIAAIERLTEEAESVPALAAQNAVEIDAIHNAAMRNQPAASSGLSDEGSGLGWATLLVAGAAAAGAVAGNRRSAFVAVGSGLALGALLIPAAWILTASRVADEGVDAGVGAAITVVGAAILLAACLGTNPSGSVTVPVRSR